MARISVLALIGRPVCRSMRSSGYTRTHGVMRGSDSHSGRSAGSRPCRSDNPMITGSPTSSLSSSVDRFGCALASASIRGPIRGDRGRIFQRPIPQPQIRPDHGGLLLFDQPLVCAR